jgi:hypothetical protein
MIRLCLILCLLISICLLTAETSLDKITVNSENLIVTRVVLSLSQKADWSYQTDTANHQINVRIRNCTSANPVAEGLQNGDLVVSVTSEIIKQDVLVKIVLSGAFYLETLHLDEPYKLVFDLFTYKSDYNYQDQLAQAVFYEKVGKWIAADKQYAQLRRDFPHEVDANFFWAKLLLKQHCFEKAKAKLEAVSSNSKFYKDAQILLTKLNDKAYGEIEEALVEKPVYARAESCATPLKKSTSTVLPAKPLSNIIRDTEKTVSIKWAELPIWAWFIVLLIVLITLLIILDWLRHHKEWKSGKVERCISFIQDDKIKSEMVRKLVANGWSETVIARELQLPVKDVRYLAKQAQNENSDAEN